MKHEKLIAQMTLEEKCYLFSGKDFWQTRTVERLGIPAMTLSDGPHGVRRQEGAGDQLGLNASLPATCFPTAAAIANSWDVALGEEIGRCLGQEAASQGVGMLLGPGLNIKRSPLCGRNFEYFSEDPYLAGKMAAAYVRGIQENGVAACPKHFAANSQELWRMASDSVLDERTLREIYLTGFEIAVREGGAKGMMSAYNRVNGVYANENAHLLEQILREEWGFDGVVVSDWGASNDHVEGVRAGSHLEMPTTGGDSDLELVEAVRAGRISQELLDRRVDELLDVILPTAAAVARQSGKRFDVMAHHNLARKASAQSIVLLKNEGVLPLASGAKVAVIGEFAGKARYQGAGSSVVNPTKVEHTMDVIAGYDLDVVGYEPGYPRSGKGDPAMLERAVQLAGRADIVLLYIGLDEISESEGLDRSHMRLPQSQIELIGAVAAVNPNIVAVMSAGSAVEMPWLDRCRALVHGYLCGQAGASAMLDVLTGKVNPSGKLAETHPLRYEDVPSAPYFPAKERNAEYREGLYVGYRYYETVKAPVCFPFGYGLSYTTFAYSDLEAGEREVSFTIANTGSVDGAEIAQVYVGKEGGEVFRPAKSLCGFVKVFLKAGESRHVRIALDDKAFRWFSIATNRYEIEGGTWRVMVGASVQDIRLEGEVSVRGTDAVSPYDRQTFAPYYSGEVKAISDAQFAALLGHPIPDGHWSRELTINDAIGRLSDARNPLARLIHRIMKRMLDKSMARGTPDLNIIFIYNMPLRGIAKMTGGMCTMEMAQGLLSMCNGHMLRGLGEVIGGYLRSGNKRRAANAPGYTLEKRQ